MQCFYHCFSRITEQQIQTKKALSYIVACFCWNKMVLTKAILSSNQSKVNHITIYINITFGIITKNLFYAKYFVVFYDDSKFSTILVILLLLFLHLCFHFLFLLVFPIYLFVHGIKFDCFLVVQFENVSVK